MFEPIRGGTRGGQAEFKWADVSADKDRENYLGHSINAPTGRWQKNKDVHWYNRDLKSGETERQAEIRRIKEAEEDALAVALGFAPAQRNAISQEPAVAGTSIGPTAEAQIQPPDDVALQMAKAEKRRRKLEKKIRKEEKRAQKETKGLKRRHSVSDHSDGERYGKIGRSRSRSPRRQDSKERGGPRGSHRTLRRYSSRSPDAVRRSSSPPGRGRHVDYADRDREHDRERDRQRWDDNQRRYNESRHRYG